MFTVFYYLNSINQTLKVELQQIDLLSRLLSFQIIVQIPNEQKLKSKAEKLKNSYNYYYYRYDFAHFGRIQPDDRQFRVRET